MLLPFFLISCGSLQIHTFLDNLSIFDSIPRCLLTHKLIKFSFSWSILAWMFSYFTDKIQYTILDGETSEPFINSLGVPQDVVQSSHLLSMCIGDLITNFSCHLLKYAQNVVFYQIAFGNKEFQSSISICLKKLVYISTFLDVNICFLFPSLPGHLKCHFIKVDSIKCLDFVNKTPKRTCHYSP